MSEVVTVGKIEMKSILPQLQEWWNDYESVELTLEGKINTACVIGERGGRIIVELEALHAQVDQAKAENARLRAACIEALRQLTCPPQDQDYGFLPKLKALIKGEASE